MYIANNISEYISLISMLTQNTDAYVYRGENKIFSTSCVPNIFREHRRLSNFNFEKNILNKIRSEGLDGNQSYLLTAIEAQHGGFPSRLLDISYNSLIALHFAVTPFYNRLEHEEDSEPGQVVIIKVEDMLSPSSVELEELYANELLNTNSLKNRLMLLAHQHKMVDYYSKNQRIKAQQGGFIIFYGNEFRPLPDYKLQRIKIPSTAKSKIRNELKRLFGISNAYVYPESNNLVASIISSTDLYANFDTFDNKAEIEKVLRNFDRNLNYYLCEILESRDELKEIGRLIDKKDSESLKEYLKKRGIDNSNISTKKLLDELRKQLVEQVIKFECYIYDFYLDFVQSKELLEKDNIEEDQKELLFFTEIEKILKNTVEQACNNVNVILQGTEITLTPYKKIINGKEE
ncbi:FRG domain-containing protein [Bacillus sp. FSL W8-0519]|uniref:FRG domain-containing protein n=1 Tax=Bacillus TaxID=1386 RepID=UPI001E4BA815|nr:FRG domain-containing protein [Bacillus paranthracis]MCC2412270.1 FRG domain-containing protein [Bacillus paranthracis]